jgi:membrane protease YdiL (CAAX protease family)
VRFGFTAVFLALTFGGTAWAQQDSVVRHGPDVSGRGDLLVPALSLLLPGFGQFALGEPLAGGAFSATAAIGVALLLSGDIDALFMEELPRSGPEQRAFYGAQLIQTAGSLSAYDAFRRSLPALQRKGEYRFLSSHEPTGRLFTAPFDFRFLARWTTWTHLAFTGAVTAVVATVGNESGAQDAPFTAWDALFMTGVSLNAGVGEEALFRGWLYPVLYESIGAHAYLPNALQAAVFGALHKQAGPFAIIIAAWSFYEGWLTKRNGWSIRESIFHHFWYDVVVGITVLLTDEGPPAVTLTFPELSF